MAKFDMTTGPAEAQRIRLAGGWSKKPEGEETLCKRCTTTLPGDLMQVHHTRRIKMPDGRRASERVWDPRLHWWIGAIKRGTKPGAKCGGLGAAVMLREDGVIVKSKQVNNPLSRITRWGDFDVRDRSKDPPKIEWPPHAYMPGKRMPGMETRCVWAPGGANNPPLVLHNETGPAVVWPTGEEYYFLWGTMVPAWFITTPPERYDLREGLTLTNAQLRAIFFRRYGIDRLWHKYAVTIDRHPDYELGLITIPTPPLVIGGQEFRQEPFIGTYLKMKNPSVPELWHVEGVPNECRTVWEALVWRRPPAMQRIPIADDGAPWYQQGDVYIWPQDAKSLQPFPSVLT